MTGEAPAASAETPAETPAETGQETPAETPNLLGDDAPAGGDKIGQETGQEEKDDSPNLLGDDGEKPDDKTGKEGDGEEKDAGAPETYEDFKLPDNFQVDEEQMGAFKDLAKELNLPQGKAQQLVDIYADAIKSVGTHYEQEGKDVYSEMVTDWEKASKTDSEFGGQKFEDSQAKAKLVLKHFGTPGLIADLGMSGMSNHPEMFRLLLKVYEAVGEDTLVGGDSGPGAAPLSRADRMYPSMRQQEK